LFPHKGSPRAWSSPDVLIDLADARKAQLKTSCFRASVSASPVLCENAFERRDEHLRAGRLAHKLTSAHAPSRLL
jgi:hypothetical protein